jgi:phage terminase small subunit
LKNAVLGKLVSWKCSFEKLNEEYGTLLKKRQALSNLFSSGKISQFIYESLDKEMDEAVAEVERQKKVLLDKMNVKSLELQQQIKILELLLAKFEIQYAGGEIEENLYKNEISLISLGLENAKKELNAIKEASEKLTCLKPSEDFQEPKEGENIKADEKGKMEVDVVEVSPIKSATHVSEEAATPTHVEVEVKEGN